MIVYGTPLSPFVRKVHLVAAEKGISVETVRADMRNPSPEFLEASPFRKIPAMRDGNFTLVDSSAIAAYLEARHPEPALFPAEPEARGRAVWFEEFADTILGPPGARMMFNRFVAPRLLGRPGDEEAAQRGTAELQPLLDWFETQTPAQGFLVGPFSIADIAVASVIRTFAYEEESAFLEARPAARAWYARVCERPAWRKVAVAEDEIARRLLGQGGPSA